MRYPTDHLRVAAHPIHCYYGFSDGFSGWYAVSRKRRCTDFCYWEVEATSALKSNGTTFANDDVSYSATNVADPHQATFISNLNSTSSWRCALDVASDMSFWSDVESKLTPIGYFGGQFPFLQCSRGPNEALETTADIVVYSQGFWWSVTIFLSALQAAFLLIAAQRRRQRNVETYQTYDPIRRTLNQVVDDDSLEIRGIHRRCSEESEREDKPLESDFEDEALAESITTTTTISDGITSNRQRYSMALFFLALNTGIIAALTISIASLIDIRGSRMVSGKAMRLTPKCYNAHSECAEGNVDIDRPSKQEHESGGFSYLVASDAQLDWYSGESPDIGIQPFPKPCSESDSCSSCTAKVGQYTNKQMVLSMEKLISGQNNSSGSIVPETLILNGDLTAYFHPHERRKYESLYHNIAGLKNYFPALGNHEVDHGSGAKFGSDQWLGSPYCNSRHSLGYIRSGFCGHIPNFDPRRIVRYDASSLAYSWEQGRYHFVHTHFYPTYESAGIGLSSSISWLDRDIKLAYEANMTTILFVHASQGLNDAVEKILLGRNVKAIFAGHSHRCLMRKCVAPRLVYEERPVGDETITNNSTNHSSSHGKILSTDSYDECLPGTAGVCGGNAELGGQSLYYLRNTSEGFTPPSAKLFHEPFIREDRKLCPAPRKIAIVNNTLRCKRTVLAASEFPPRQENPSTDGNTSNDIESGKHIPIFWSGSASFQAFLKVDFYEDRFVVNVMTAAEGVEGRRYMDIHSVPNVVYPHHNEEDMGEFIIRL